MTIGKLVVIDTKSNFEAKLNQGQIPSLAVVFIKDVGQIYAHGTYFGAQKTHTLLTKTADGLAPKGGTSASSQISNVDTEWVLTVTSGADPSWRKLPANAFENTIYTLPSATTTNLGGLKVGNVNTSAFADLNGNYYKLNIDKDGLGYVNIPYATLAAKVTCTASTDNIDKPIVLTNTSNSLYYSTKATINYSTGHIKAGALTSTGQITLYSSSGDSPHLYFQRGTISDGTYDWDQYVTSDYMKFRYNNAGTWTEVLSLYPGNSTLDGYKILHAGNSSVSGDGGSTWGSSITVKINGTSKTLTIPANPLSSIKTLTFSAGTFEATTYNGSSDVIVKIPNNFNHIGDATSVSVTSGTVKRKVIVTNVKSEGYISRASIGLSNPANQFSPVIIGVGTNDGGTTFTDYYFHPGGSITDSKGNTYAKTSDIPTIPSLSLGTTTGSGNAVTSISVSGHTITLNKGTTFSVSGHNHDDKYVNVTGDTMTGALTFTAGGVIITTNITSNYKRLASFYKGASANTTYTYDAQIGWHNTGDNDGAIILLPHTTDDAPWNGNTGLYISKTRLLYNGQTILHSGNYDSYLGYIGTTVVQKSSASQALTGITSATLSGPLTLTGTTSANARINFSRGSDHDYPYNYITAPTGGIIAIEPGLNYSSATGYQFTATTLQPGTTNTYDIGTSSLKWKNVYATTFTGALSGNADSSTYTTYIRVTETEPTSGTYYYPIWTTGMTSGSNYTPRANDGFRYYSLEGTTSAKGTGLLFLGNSTAEGTAGNKEGRLGIYGPKSYYAYLYGPDTATGTFYFPNAGGTLVTHATRGTAVGAPQTPVYIAANGRATACTIDAGSGNSNRSLMVTNGSNGMYYTPSITGNYLNGALISTVSDTTTVRHTCTNSNGSVSLYASTNRGLYDTTNSAWIIYLTKDADHVYVPKWASKGSSTSPVYFNSSGEPVACSGLNADTTDGYHLYTRSLGVNGTSWTFASVSSSNATTSIYAPTEAGTSGQFLQSTGGVPGWVSINYYNANTSRISNTVLAAPNGSNGVASFRKLVAADLPTMYWANVAISSSSSTTKAPTFANVTLGAASSSGTINVLRDSANYIICGSTNGSGGYLAIVPDAQSPSLAASDLVVSNGAVYPGTDSVTTLGKSANYWSNTYSDTVTTTLVTNSAAVVINSETEVRLKYNNTNSTSIVLNSTAFKPFTAATSKLMLGNSSSLWKGIYTSINTSTALNNVGLNYCNSSGIIVGCMASSSSAIGIYSTGSIYLRGGCTAATSAGTAPTSSGTGLVIDSTGNASANNFTSTVATGTRPLIVTSTTKCTNLNADFWDGYHLSVTTSAGTNSSTIYFVT